MRFTLCLFLLAQAGSVAIAGKLPPLNTKDLSLMLRSGYSSQAVQHEISARRFLDSIDAEKESALLKVGAAPDLIAQLKHGAYDVAPGDLASAEKEMIAREQRRAAQIEMARAPEPAARGPLAAPPARPSAAAAMAPRLADSIRGNLVSSRNGILQTFNNQALEKKKLIALYFSARWCPECREFTPLLVEYYNRSAAAHPEFELIFVSRDRSASAMEQYMRDAQMPWPAVAYDQVAQNETLLAYAGPGIPCLVLLDAGGRVLSNSYDGKTFLGPAKVLADLDRIFEGGAERVAQERSR